MSEGSDQQRKVNNKQDFVLAKAQQYAYAVYDIALLLPKFEQFALSSQLRRAALSVPLNIVEGFARQSPRTEVQFLRIAYGSLKESQFILQFVVRQKYLPARRVAGVISMGDEAGRLIWSKTQTLGAKTGSTKR